MSTQGGQADHKDYMMRGCSLLNLFFFSPACHVGLQDIHIRAYCVIIVSPEELKKCNGELIKLFRHELLIHQISSIVWDEGHTIGAKS